MIKILLAAFILELAALLPRQNPVRDSAEMNVAQSVQSVVSLLSLDATEIQTLDRIYYYYAMTRLEQEVNLAHWQVELSRSYEQIPPDVERAARIRRNITLLEQEIAVAFMAAREEAYRSLSVRHKAHLETLPASVDFYKPDKYRELLIMPPVDLWKTPIAPDTAQRVIAQEFQQQSANQYRYFSSPAFYRGYGSGYAVVIGGYYYAAGYRGGGQTGQPFFQQPYWTQYSGTGRYSRTYFAGTFSRGRAYRGTR